MGKCILMRYFLLILLIRYTIDFPSEFVSKTFPQTLDALVAGLGDIRHQVDMQYAVLERKDETHELVEKMYFDHCISSAGSL